MQTKSHSYQVPRLAFFWLLIAQTFLLLPHFFQFNFVLLPLWCVCSAWRVMIYRSQAAYPNQLFKAVFVIVSVVLIRIIQDRWLMLETAILMLLMAFLLKLLEMRDRRDVLILIYLAYFVLSAQVLLSQTFFDGLYLLVGLLLITTSLVALHSGKHSTAYSLPFNLAGKMLAVSLPMMLVGFLVFPRLDPLWKVPMPTAGKTGVSGVMSPGLFSKLAQSDAVAFRVKFKSQLPKVHEMYWRGLTLPVFDGVQWRPSDDDPQPLSQSHKKREADFDYQLTMEPSQQSWLFLLGDVDYANPAIVKKLDGSFQSIEPIEQTTLWHVTSSLLISSAELDEKQRDIALQLPEGFNPQAIAFAKQLRESSADEQGYINQVLAYFREQPFYYSLNPPLLEKNGVDDFLFVKRKGFCEHYAASFVVLMRAANIPARVVAGYQGGDVNPYEYHVTVRQMDAHAWTEVWMKDKGWVLIDPTYAVAPERIDKGSQLALQDDAGYLAENPLSPLRLRSVSWFNKIQYRYDQFNFLWQTRVLQYSSDRQLNFLQALLGEVSMLRIGLFVLMVFLAVSFSYGAFILWRYQPQPLSPLEKQYRRWLKYVKRHGISKTSSEGAIDFSKRVEAHFPLAKNEIQSISANYCRGLYDPRISQEEKEVLLNNMISSIEQFRRIIA